MGTIKQVISTDKGKGRDSNMELLRIVAMFLVMIVHASFKALGAPTIEDVRSDAVGSFLRFLSESLSVVCVNVFVLLSGWYGIKAKFVRLSEFLFQVFFIGIVMYLSLYLIGHTNHMGIKGWGKLFLMNDHWFVKSYIILYIFTPLLNSFISTCSKNQFECFLVTFFIIQTVYDSLTYSTWFSKGYSPLSFMGLYMLARYLRLYPNKCTTLNKCWDILLYFGLSFLIAIISYIIVITSIETGWIMMNYSNPLVILSAIYFLLFFTKVSFKSKLVNWISISSFAAYLVHCDVHFLESVYLETISQWFQTENTLIFVLRTTFFIMAIFLFAILLDKIRIRVWNLMLQFNWQGTLINNLFK